MITNDFRENLATALAPAGEEGRVQLVEDVDVKDLLELGRVIIEKGADLTPRLQSQYQAIANTYTKSEGVKNPGKLNSLS